MISRPTTDQVLLDCSRELLDTVLPKVTDPAAAVAVQMLENVLRNAATRAAHEIAWMAEESEEMLGYARDVAASLPGSAELESALSSARPATSLHLADVVAAYSRAGEALSCGVEAAMAAGASDLVARGVALIAARTEREQEVKGDWSMIGRG